MFIQKSELLSLIIRAVGVITAACSSFISLKILLQLPEPESILLIAISGWIVFIPLGQLGYGRPVYGYLRKDYESGKSNRNIVEYFLLKCRKQVVAITIIFSICSYMYARYYGSSINVNGVIIFALGLAALNSGIYQRDIAYAQSSETKYELVELCRRLILLFGFFAIEFGLKVWQFGILIFITGVLSQKILEKILISQVNVAREQILLKPNILLDLRKNSRYYLFFTANELLLYNLPLLVFTVLGGSREIVLISIWMRLFQILVLPMRLLVDARMNRIVSAYFRGSIHEVRKSLILNVISSIFVTAVILILIVPYNNKIFIWLGAKALVDEPCVMLSLCVWAFFNSIQHSFGSFIISNGGSFSFACKMSVLTLISISLTFSSMYQIGLSLGEIMLGTGITYGLFAFNYARKALSLLQSQKD